jgi:hypothetical protein
METTIPTITQNNSTHTEEGDEPYYPGLREFLLTSTISILDSICWRARFQWFQAERNAMAEGRKIVYFQWDRRNHDRRSK